MATRDPAFQWETEVLRSRGAARLENEAASRTIDRAGDWLTVNEASEATGVPTSTIRKWARHDNIPSLLEQTADGYLRMVSMSGITHWTREIGREIEGAAEEAADGEVDLTAAQRPAETEVKEAVPEGSMIVPLDAWNRMLNQLGNLHEAGQQLAEARERAAKAETEARFLKERLSELRTELEKATQPPPAPEHPGGVPPAAGPEAGPSTGLVRKAYEGWRSKRRRR